MAPDEAPARRRPQVLSRERVVGEAIRLLDERGEHELTVRALTRRLGTGAGAVYWHVPSKAELFAAATSTVVAAALDADAEADDDGSAGAHEASDRPQDRIRAAALGLYDAVVEHPWLASQLPAYVYSGAEGSVTPRLYDRFARQVRALGTPESAWFVTTSALVHYVLGALGQNAGNAGGPPSEVDRAAYLDATATTWESLDEADFPLARVLAGQLREHDDREQFLAGIDVITAGIVSGIAAGTTGG